MSNKNPNFAKFLIANLIEDSSLQNQYTSYYSIFGEVSEGIDYEWNAEGNTGEPTKEFSIESIENTPWQEQSNLKGWDWETIAAEMVELGYVEEIEEVSQEDIDAYLPELNNI